MEKGNLQGTRGLVTQRNKGRGRVVLSIGGIEIKMERHLLGKYGLPHTLFIYTHTNSFYNLYIYELYIYIIHTYIIHIYRPRNKVGSIMAAGGVLRPGQERELTAKEKRLFKILSEELVDPDNLTGSGAGGGKKRPPSSSR